MNLRFATVASGISAETYAWKPLGWQPVWYSEIEPFANAVLSYHYPEVPNLGDMNHLHNKQAYHETTFDVFAGGTPCQGFSLAGKRGGMDDPRSGLAFRFLDIIKHKRPRWVVWENVPDVLSSAGGRDFTAFISRMEACGYGVAWRILDAQYAGLAQRRKRIFVVGYIGDWRPAAAVLFDRASLQGRAAPSREKRKSITYDIAPCLRGCSVGGERVGDSRENDPFVPVSGTLVSGGKSAGSVTNQDIDQNMLIPEVSLCLLANGQRIDLESQSLIVAPDIAQTLTAHQHRSGGASAGNNPGLVNAIYTYNRVRRLTPVEYERLQGFPDNYTQIPYRGRPAEKCADGPRYRAVGNSIATPILKWIGERIEMVERIKQQLPCR
jgi:DNA (cytosine-5)-methyltransferase 1